MTPLYYNITRRLAYGLPRELWVVEAGIFLNYLGWGAVLPFEVIYLHDARGFALGVSGLVVGAVTLVAVATAPVVGPVIDRIGARTTAAAAGVALAAGYAGLAFVHTPAEAFAAAVVAGLGSGALQPSQSALLASLAQPQIRHRSTAVSRVAANLGVGLGAALGGLVATRGLNGFVALLLGNAVSYLLYVAILVLAVREDARPEPVAGGYRLVLRDRAFVRLALINVAVIAVGWGVFTWVVPPYARGEVGAGPQVIGLLLLANALTVVLAQIPVARLAEGRRRAAIMAAGALAFVPACLLVLAAGYVELGTAQGLLLTAAVVVGVGECFHTTALMPLVADLAPPAIRGRYMAATSLSWWLGLALAPTLGTQLLSVSPPATMLVAAAVALGAAVSGLALERHVPVAARFTPRPAAET
jgi:MFS family permease